MSVGHYEQSSFSNLLFSLLFSVYVINEAYWAFSHIECPATAKDCVDGGFPKGTFGFIKFYLFIFSSIHKT